MGLLASLYAAFFGTRRSGEQEQPGELTAVSPDFTGFVSNRPHEPDTSASLAVDAGTAEQDHAHPAPDEAAHQRESPSLAATAGASELTAIAPEFSGRVSNRPQPSGPATDSKSSASGDPPLPGP